MRSQVDVAPIPVQWDSVVVQRTIDRRTGVVIAEDVMCSEQRYFSCPALEAGPTGPAPEQTLGCDA